MAHWGVAYAFGPHVNKPMDSNDTAGAWAALQLAVANKAKVSPREQAYITALEKRYQSEHKDDRSALDKAFADAMRQLVKHYPDDLDAQVLFAESLMDTMPWDYWTRDRTPKPETEEILGALRFVMARDPNHPGANHFYIHAVEAGPNPEHGLPAADRLRDYAPAAGHLVHMPSHIYVRVGQYHDAVTANERAVKADRDYIRHCRALGFYPGVYYPHNMHFLWWAQLFEGRSKDALHTANEAAAYALDNYCGPKKALEAPRVRHLPWLTLIRFGRWEEALAIAQPPRTNDFLVDRALWHFTRGLAFAAQKNVASAEREQLALSAIAASEEAKKLNSPAFPAADMLAVSAYWLAGKVAGAKGDLRAMIEQVEKAVAAEDAIPYMEPSYWPIPVRPALGAALLQAGDAAKAEQVFREDLKRWARNGWSLFGLEQSLLAQGKNQAADLVRCQFETAWKRADTKLDLTWF
jgi:tetratricopeptide (TPR) repeat protein